jgi:hypothetical protein
MLAREEKLQTKMLFVAAGFLCSLRVLLRDLCG